ncbi:2-C-methyl-D-erythritol 4-phosphate cytidylyltransferase [Pedobacter psychrotolerans]|uniref:2-C-methyl-D-erythritol 4-phosphate cytidylyltransferase n=1 Tax=Pedobacter psychrotolerans TaxID=1843235 RepID=A0A4R2H3K7_9SPHI|nr:2-C-methyl-D-erythritol 4-phosphate cytidylyltransferase [Pedobacter psychrotolerans]TCO19871.1 2-C-methyl-D-erythritol 4-phosphate cytidylyltransferase [Pedobacter psychrotolerans]GGE49498.1 2-C-methyl-D-erythritol 4-phosphate cytidylyltransferase [Pedobacter psychrotolerans]
MKYYAIIVAGGSGNRMQTETPKQFLLLRNLPVLMHTIKAFAQSDTQPKILLVLNIDQQRYWRRLCEEFNFRIPHEIINGGTERFYSVKNAIDSINEESFVAIHDAVRPLVSKALIDNCFKRAEAIGNVIAAVQSSDSVRMLRGDESTALKRDEIYLVQTPQTFSLNILKKAYLQEFTSHFTDDASVVEALKENINIIEGERNNIKITYPIDLELAELLLKK